MSRKAHKGRKGGPGVAAFLGPYHIRAQIGFLSDYNLKFFRGPTPKGQESEQIPIVETVGYRSGVPPCSWGHSLPGSRRVGFCESKVNRCGGEGGDRVGLELRRQPGTYGVRRRYAGSAGGSAEGEPGL